VVGHVNQEFARTVRGAIRKSLFQNRFQSIPVNIIEFAVSVNILILIVRAEEINPLRGVAPYVLS